MLVHTSACASVLLAASAVAQKLNTWPQHNYGGSGRDTDGDITTAEEEELSPSLGAGRFALLFNNYITLSGLYILSPADGFITDYHVGALLDRNLGFLEVGRVCGATGSLTFVPLVNPTDGGPARTDTLFVDVTANEEHSSTFYINEIWPVFPGDEIVDPGNTSPCPAATSA